MFIAKGSQKSKNRNSNSTSNNGKHTNFNSTSNPDTKAKAKSKTNTASPPTTVPIRGINVHFPFTPYNNQKAYMATVMDALHNSENALLESPTGTGKTLCLLCSTLAWQLEQKSNMNVTMGDAANANASTTANVNATANADTSTSSNKRKVPTIIYASRTHSQLSQVVKELRFTRYRPNHAVLGSREQMCIHPKVNPSKSASASKRKSIQNNTPVSSSDINHACTKLNKERKCRHRNNLDGFVLTTDETTATTQSSTSTTITEQIQQPILDIEELVTLGQSRTICPFYFSRSQIPEADIIFIPYNYLFDADTRKHSLHEIEFENSIIIFDEAHNLESFASESASFDLTSIDIAGCIIEVSRCMGYVQSMPDLAENGNDNSGNGGGGGGGGRLTAENLLNLKSIFLQLEHYMEEVVPPNGGSYSGEYIFEILAKGANLTFKNHVIFVKFIRTVSDFVMDMKGGQGGSSSGGNTTSSGTPKLDHFVSCVKKVYGTPTELQSMAKARSYRVHVSPKSKGGKGGGFMGGGGGGGHGNIQGRTLSYWCFAPALAMNELAALKVRSILVTSGTLSPLPSYSLELGLHFPHTLENEHIITQEQISVRVIGKGVSGKALTSTYNRRDDAEYITELGNTIISLCRVIPDGVLIFFPSYGVMETCIERWGGPASSRSRNQNYSKKNNFFQAKKRRNSQTPGAAAGTGRYCFPKTAVSSGTNLTPWQRLLAIKAIVLEPKTSSELKDVIDEFDKFISLPKSSGCIMIGVCRGKISEGIDFADEKCRAVIITGLPFAPYLDPKVKLKREYLDGIRSSMTSKPSGEGGFDGAGNNNGASQNVTLSGAEWYSQQAHRAVNQAIGRVIRHRFDYGAILFLDSRFGEPRNQLGVSKWIRPSFVPDKGVGPSIGALVKFYRGAQKKVDANKEASKGIVKPSIKLKYENDDRPNQNQIRKTKEDNFGDKIKTVAFIKNNANDQSVNDGYVRPDRIIKQVDLKNHKSERVIVKTETSAASKIRRRLQQQKKANQSSKTEVEQQQKNDAKRFFSLAQECLSPPDFQLMRKILIRMKSFGDVKDSESYLAHARKLVDILLQYDPCKFESQTLKKSQNLVESLLPLLPLSYRYSIDKMACQIRYDNSIFKEECIRILKPEECDVINCKFPFLMINHDRDSKDASDSHKRRNKTLYLGDYQIIIKPLFDNVNGMSLLQHLYHLIPKDQINNVRTLVNQYQATRKIKALKENDKKRYGESGVKTALFQKPTEQNWSVGVEKETQEKKVEDVIEMKEALFRASSMKKDKYDEQKKSWEASRSGLLKQNTKRKNGSSNGDKTPSSNALKNTKKSSLFSTTATRPSKRAKSILEMSIKEKRLNQNVKLSQSSSAMDDLDKCLEVAKADIYKKAPRRVVSINRVKSNTPAGVTCIICKNPSKKLLIAKCNHIACLDCWSKWLNRSKTCPSCRKPTSKEELSKLVFHDEEKSLPTLTQMCASDDDDEDNDSDDDGELEIIGK